MTNSNSSSTREPRKIRGTLVAAGVLLALAIVVPLLVSTYARATPVLWGFPFFYWYQLLWVFICAALVSTAHRIMLLDEKRRRAARDARGTATTNNGGAR